MQGVLFEYEWVSPLVALVVGLVVGLGLNRAGRGRGALAAWGVGVVACAGLAVSTRLVETGREATTRGAVAFVDLMVAGDGEAVEGVVSGRMTMTAGGDLVSGYGRGALVAFAPSVPGYVTECFRSVSRSEASGGEVETDVWVRVTAGTGVGSYEFRLTWSKEGPADDQWGGWRIVRIDLTEVNNRPVESGWVRRWM